ncbi:prostatic spermine-binding protein-like [Eriocheir sinensis]|uniref:prostatic spermine-binding protein-like n=1 Tax=Eriocheir sinensis TaxID=95602 RepID=UPI0021C64FDC|nr:prostatic spermine-binding protein-like [Eriocheir sinensis]
MVLLRVCVAAAVAVVVVLCDPAVETQAKTPLVGDDFDYLDDVKGFEDIKDEVNHRYSAKINQMDMLEDYPYDDDDDDHHHHYPGDVGDEDYDDEDYDEGDEDENDEDDDEDGGCGGDDDDEDEELSPVEQVIEDFFTR